MPAESDPSDPSNASDATPVRAARRKRSVDVTFDKVQAQLLRSCKPAVRKLARAARGRSVFRNELALRACLGLARIAADLLYGRAMKAPRAPEQDNLNERSIRALNRYLKGGA